MNELPRDLARPARSKPVRIAPSACPHDCPSTCALEVEVLDSHTIGRVRGAAEQSYTAGVICAKVARYAERVHHPDRLLRPLRRKGEKARANSPRSRGTMRSISSPSGSSAPRSATARRRSGPITTPAPWAW